MRQVAPFLIPADLRQRGLRQFLPGKAEFDLRYHRPACKLYLVDCNRALSRAEAEAVAAAL